MNAPLFGGVGPDGQLIWDKKIYNPQQQEIEFFWPLVEQIPLDLDYSNCEKPKLTVVNTSFGTGTTISSLASGASWTTTQFKMQENQTTMIVIKEPNFIRKLIYKLIGFKWEVN